MKYVIGIVISTILIMLVITGNNWSARKIGGEIHLPANKKLVNVTWKNSSLWILIRPMKSTEVPEVYEFIESSNLDIFNGTVHIIEHKGGGSSGTQTNNH